MAWVLTVGVLAQTLRLPEWARNASPVYVAGRVPIDDPRPGALALMAALTLALLVAAWLRFTPARVACGLSRMDVPSRARRPCRRWRCERRMRGGRRLDG